MSLYFRYDQVPKDKLLHPSEALSDHLLAPIEQSLHDSSMTRTSSVISRDSQSHKGSFKVPFHKKSKLTSAPSFKRREDKPQMLKVQRYCNNFLDRQLSLQIIPMLLMVVILFIVCWSPLLIFEVLQSFNVLPTQLFDEHKHIKTSASLLAYLNR